MRPKLLLLSFLALFVSVMPAIAQHEIPLPNEGSERKFEFGFSENLIGSSFKAPENVTPSGHPTLYTGFSLRKIPGDIKLNFESSYADYRNMLISSSGHYQLFKKGMTSTRLGFNYFYSGNREKLFSQSSPPIEAWGYNHRHSLLFETSEKISFNFINFGFSFLTGETLLIEKEKLYSNGRQLNIEFDDVYTTQVFPNEMRPLVGLGSSVDLKFRNIKASAQYQRMTVIRNSTRLMPDNPYLLEAETEYFPSKHYGFGVKYTNSNAYKGAPVHPEGLAVKFLFRF